MSIHPTAIVHREARLAAGVVIGPYSIVEEDVELGSGCVIGAQAVLKSGLRLGEGVRVGEGAVLGGEPQDLKFEGAPSYVVVGNGTVVREFATIHRSTHPEGVTRIGRSGYLMAYAHVAHDCVLGDEAVIASFTALAGHVRIGRGAFVSGGVVIHQFCRIGDLAMVGGGSKVTLDAPPFFTVDGAPAKAVGLNLVGLRRAGVSAADIRELKRAFRLLYRSGLSLAEALRAIEELEGALTARLVEAVRSSERGICRARR